MTRWQPFNPVWTSLNQLQSEMNRLFQRWTEEGPIPGAWAPFPALNMWEEGEHVFLTAELPGLSMEDLEIYVTGKDQLTIKGERKFTPPEKAVRHRQERSFGKFNRLVQLPFAVDADKVDARLERGILHLKLAKHESAKPRKIVVTGE